MFEYSVILCNLRFLNIYVRKITENIMFIYIFTGFACEYVICIIYIVCLFLLCTSARYMGEI